MNNNPEPLPVRAWWSMASTAVSDLEQASRFNLNTLIIENDIEVLWHLIIDGLATYDFSDRYRREGVDRSRVESLRAHYGKIFSTAREQGVDTYIMCPEIHVPTGFESLSYDNPELWPLLRDRLREVFRALPGLSGFMLYTAESEADVINLPGTESSQARRIRKLIDTLWEACLAEGRKLLVTTYCFSLETLETVAGVLRTFPAHPDFAVVQYCCPSDWGLCEVMNPSIGRIGPHPEILAFDYAAENWGIGAHPFIQVEFMVRRLREARERGANPAGLAGYVAWYGRSALGTFNEANIFAAAALAENPDRNADDILHEWCTQRFGPDGAEVAATCLGRTRTVVYKSQHVFDYWLDTGEKSGLPSLEELDQYFIEDIYGEALCKWDSSRQIVWDRIQNPDEAFIDEILKEKDEAIAICLRSLEEIRSAQERFTPDDFQALEHAITFQALWARLWRELVHAYFLHRICLIKGHTPERATRLHDTLDTLSLEADELERRFGKDVFPQGPDRARAFIQDVKSHWDDGPVV